MYSCSRTLMPLENIAPLTAFRSCFISKQNHCFFLGRPNRFDRQCKKTHNEKSNKVRNEVVKKFRAGIGYKTIFLALYIICKAI